MDIYVYRYLCPQAIQTVLSDVDRFPPLRKRTPRVDLVGTGKADEERRQRRKELLAEGTSFHQTLALEASWACANSFVSHADMFLPSAGVRV
mgnify:CR=1 FL=1